jgi:WD40 repeat protein
MTGDSFADLAAWLGDQDSLTPRELADALWLADTLGHDLPPPPEEAVAGRQLGKSAAPRRGQAQGQYTADDDVPPDRIVIPAQPDKTPPHRPGSAQTLTAQPATPVQVRTPSLRSTLSPVARAVRPLARLVPAPGDGAIDEAATVHRSAEAGTLLPVLDLQVERWLELTLVVDASASMTLWRPVIDELTAGLARQRIFRNIRTWHIDGDDTSAWLVRGLLSSSVASPTGERSLAELNDPNGRRLILVVTDGVGSLWRGPGLVAAVNRWAAASPVVFAQVLPERLWHRTGLPAMPVLVRSAPSRGGLLAVRPVWPTRHTDAADQPWVPVVPLDPAQIQLLAGTLAGDTAGWIPGTALRLTNTTRSQPHAAAPIMSVPELLKGFRLTASPAAFELANRLAAAPLTLPVMRMVQEALVPAAGPAGLAEVLLSGLLTRVAGTAQSDPEDIVYDFVPGARDELLANLSRADAFGVLTMLADCPPGVAAPLGGTLDFRAFLADPHGKATMPAESWPFAKVAATVLRSLGRSYRELADHIERPRSEGENHSDGGDRLGSQLGVVAAVLSVAGRPLLLVGHRNGAASGYDLATGRLSYRLRSPGAAAIVAVAGIPVAGKARWVLATADGSVVLCDTKQGKQITEYHPTNTGITAMACAIHNGAAVATVADTTGDIHAVDLSTGAVRWTRTGTNRVTSLTTIALGDRTTLLAATDDGAVIAYPLPPATARPTSTGQRAPAARRLLSIGVGSRVDPGERGATLPALPSVRARSDELTAAFESMGYKCTQAIDRPAADIEHALRTTLSPENDTDVVAIYVAGHGIADSSGGPALLTADGQRINVAQLVSETNRTGPTLVLIDACTGAATFEPPQPPQRQQRVPRLSSEYALITCQTRDVRSYDAPLCRAVTAVVAHLHDGQLDVAPNLAHVPIEVITRSLRRELDLLDASAQTAPTLWANVAGHPAGLAGGSAFLPNPRYRPAPASDDVFDSAHFVNSAAGHPTGPGPSGAGYFHGRRRELKVLTAWLAGTLDRSHTVVTGGPGIGKSALLGMLVCAAHPALYNRTWPIWELAFPVPPVVHAPFAAVHARACALAEIVTSLAQQLGLASGTGERWTAAEFVDVVARLDHPPILVVDAVDESTEPEAVVSRLLMPLIRLTRPDGSPACRLLVATRPLLGLGITSQDGPTRTYLLEVDPVQQADLRDYITDLLQLRRPPHTGELTTERYRAFADTAARELAKKGAQAFLVAQLCVEMIATRPIPHILELGRHLPTNLADILELGWPATAADEWTAPVLAALSCALGKGMPASLAGQLAAAIAHRELPDSSAITRSLDSFRHHLETSTDIDGTVLYRLSHHALADALRPRTRDPAAKVLVDGLVRAGTPWPVAEPYVLRHAMDHLAPGGGADSLWQDVDFVVHADPDALDRALPLAHSPMARTVADAFRSVTGWRQLTPHQRVESLRVTAGANAEADRLRGRLDQISRRAPAEETDQPSVLVPGTAATAMTSVDINGVPLVAVGGTDSRLHLWQLDPPRSTQTAPLAAPATVLAPAIVDGQPVVIAGDRGGTLRVWELPALRPARVFAGHSAPVQAVITADLAGTPVAASVAANATVSMWDLRSGELLRTFDASPFPPDPSATSARQPAASPLRILGVHSIGNRASGPTQLRTQWSAALLDGTQAVGIQVDPSDIELAVVYYADLIENLTREPSAPTREVDERDTVTSPEPTQLIMEMAEGLPLASTTAKGRRAPLRQLLTWLGAQSGLGSVLLQHFMIAFVRELSTYLNKPDVRQAVLDRVHAELNSHRPHVVIAHSMGSIVAYDTLWAYQDVPVDLLVTAGSPLGMKFVIDRLLPLGGNIPRRRPPNVNRWINIAHQGDIFAIPHSLSDKFAGVGADIVTEEASTNPHKVSDYLSSPALAQVLAQYRQGSTETPW